MPAPIAPFLPDRFRSAVPFYVEGRLDYPRRLIENVAGWLGISASDRVLDLGCGPGFLAIAFAELGCTSIGIDPDKAMLAAAKELAAGRGVRCEFREGSSYDLSAAFGPVKLVTTLLPLDGQGRDASRARCHHRASRRDCLVSRPPHQVSGKQLGRSFRSGAAQLRGS
jgi:SAM-dependent methyltransferase